MKPFVPVCIAVLLFAAPAFAQRPPMSEEEKAYREAPDEVQPTAPSPYDENGQPIKKNSPGAYNVYGATPGDKEAGDYVSQPMYNNMVRQAIMTRPRDFDFTTLRSFYPRTHNYDPIGEATRSEIVKLAYTIENDPDQKKRGEAFDKYGEMVSSHLANIDVVTQALLLSKQDKMYGDTKFYEWVRAGLLRSIVQSGNGRSEAMAYDVMTLGEETALINALRLKVLATNSEQQGRTYFNMYQVKDPRYLQPYWLFIDVTQPMRFLQRQKEQEANTYSIRGAAQ